ncbi:single-stranded DNA-binding protein, mitochondrial [Octopus vulgaris]|uniref:Single-stranded DNA-binding protein, mitochondrial n=1 Tax=Octopus vulgaris TaxID=6645 RepID=A0AA36F315_OCTVU|nr:single-stranded DNA-binding protein, mitochondrial [Octopus vulgaris]
MFTRNLTQLLRHTKYIGIPVARCADDATSLLKFEKCLNQVNLIGRIGRDAEARGSESHPVIILSLATSFVYSKSSGETISRTDWHRVSVFKAGLRDKVAAYIRKGDRVFVSGTLQYNEYWDSGNVLQKSTTIIANDIINLTKKYLKTDEELDM